MAKRTATYVARSIVVVLTLLVGVLFAGHNLAFADIVPNAIEQTDQSIFESVDGFLTGGVNEESSLSTTTEEQTDLTGTTSTSTEISISSTATSTAVGGTATTTDFEIGTSTEAATTEATSTLPFDGTSTSTPVNTGSTTNATSTSTTTETGSTTPPTGGLATTTNATSTATSTQTGTGTTTPEGTSTSTASTTIPDLGGGSENATSTASSSLFSLELLSATTTATTSELSATSTATTTQTFRVKYYRYDDARTDMAGWGIPFDEIQGIDPGDPLATDWTKDWFTVGFLKNVRTEENIRFKDRFIPFANSTDPILDPESYIAAPNFGAHFMGLATVSEEGDYTVTITTDGDTWFYIDRNLQLKNLSGIKEAETMTKTIHMVPGQQYVVNMFFTERIALYPYFDFSFPGVTITPCNDDSCEPDPLDPDTTGPSAPVVTIPVPPISSTTTDITIPITWTDSTDPVISGAITSGIRGYVFIWDQIATTTPTLESGTLTTSTTTVITNLTPGIWWFHVIAIDNAGNTSAPTTHHGPFCVGLASCEDTPPISGPFEIRDLRATDITRTSVIIRWKTTNSDGSDHPASSRVVYGLTSRGLSTSTPNYDYESSTGVFDGDNFVVEHSVTITGLAENTAHYFRAISEDATSTVVSGEISATTLAPEVPPVTPPGGGGGGGGGSSRIISSKPVAITTPTTTPALTCNLYLLKFIKLGADNDPVEVRKLQAFLRVFEGRTDVPISGFYDLQTYNAVKDFQKKYGLDVLNPWGIGDSTGYVFITTTLKINYIYCGNPERITLNLRNFYGPQEQQVPRYAVGPKKDTIGYGTSTASSSKILPLATTGTTTATDTQNTVQLAFAGIADFLVEYPWVWILLLLLAIVYFVWTTRSKDGEDKKSGNDLPPQS